MDHFVAELAKCQKALGGEYLFASPEEEFEPTRLDGVACYRMHKLMEGLLAAHREAGNAQALEVLTHLADWIEKRVKRYGDQFEIVKKTGYGGMTEAFENLFSITGNPRDNLLKVTQSLFNLTGDAQYMDYYKRGLFNAILGSQAPESGWKTYYQPLNANTLNDFRSHLDGCYCCNGTGLENPAKYGSAIYSHNQSGLRVNLFIASVPAWPERGLRIKQTTRFPEDTKETLYYPYTVELSDDGKNWRMFDDQADNSKFSESYRHEGREKIRYVKLTVLPRTDLEGNAARPKIAELKVFGTTQETNRTRSTGNQS